MLAMRPSGMGCIMQACGRGKVVCCVWPTPTRLPPQRHHEASSKTLVAIHNTKPYIHTCRPKLLLFLQSAALCHLPLCCLQSTVTTRTPNGCNNTQGLYPGLFGMFYVGGLVGG